MIIAFSAHFMYIHSVGFCVARSSVPGNARTSECGASKSKVPTLFYIYAVYANNKPLRQGTRA